jgi:hypothetical protein
MTRFSSQRRAREARISFRVTEEQEQILAGIASRLGLQGTSEAVRQAIDFWIQTNPAVQRIVSQLEQERRDDE